MTGWTDSPDFPAMPGTFDGSYNGCGSSVAYCDAFVVKLHPGGTGLAYATFLGGNGRDYGVDIALERAGNIYVTGYTGASHFPTTSAAFDTRYNVGN